MKKQLAYDLSEHVPTPCSNISATPIGQTGLEMGWFPLGNGVCLIMKKAPSDSPIWQLKKRELLLPLLGWFKNPLSSQTEKLMAATKFSDYLGEET